MEMGSSGSAARRHFLQTALSAAGLAYAGCASAAAVRGEGDQHDEAEVTPGEDLMQEHGVLRRILLVYDEATRRIEQNEPLELGVITRAAEVVRRFVEDYHERTEEREVFPRLEAAQREVALVAVLRQQHQRGRELTDEIARLAQAKAASPDLSRALHSFTRMYRPHAAREDTVLFPAFRALVGGRAYHELGEKFEHEEHARFGEHGFENAVAEVARLEEAFGLGDLARFTP